MPAIRANNGRPRLTERQKQRIVEMVRAHHSYRAVGAKFGVSHERVRQIVSAADPKLIHSRRTEQAAKRPEPPETRYCVVHATKALKRGQRRYCGASCAEAMRVLKEKTDYRLAHLKLVAKREGRKGITAKAIKGQVLHRNSKAYKLLKKHGLLDRLPERVQIV